MKSGLSKEGTQTCQYMTDGALFRLPISHFLGEMLAERSVSSFLALCRRIVCGRGRFLVTRKVAARQSKNSETVTGKFSQEVN